MNFFKDPKENKKIVLGCMDFDLALIKDWGINFSYGLYYL